MEDTVKGVWISLALISLFITAIINFIVMFPQEQGFVFSDNDNFSAYNVNVINKTYISDDITNADDTAKDSYDEWDIEVGFMGSNTQKSASKNLKTTTSNIFANIRIIANELFSTKNGVHPVLYVIGIFATLTSVVITYVSIKFIRTGA